MDAKTIEQIDIDQLQEIVFEKRFEQDFRDYFPKFKKMVVNYLAKYRVKNINLQFDDDDLLDSLRSEENLQQIEAAGGCENDIDQVEWEILTVLCDEFIVKEKDTLRAIKYRNREWLEEEYAETGVHVYEIGGDGRDWAKDFDDFHDQVIFQQYLISDEEQ